MEEADKILIDTLVSIGLDIVTDNTTLENFSPDNLIAATSLCLESIFESKNDAQTFPKSCPINMAARYKVGQSLSEAIKSLGFKDVVGYQSFLYPNVRDTRRIISFLVEKLPKDAGTAMEDGGNELNRLNNRIKQIFADNWRSPWLPYYCANRTYGDSRMSSHYLMIDSEIDRIKLKQLSWWFDSFPPFQAQISDTGDLLVSIYEYEYATRLSEGIDRSRLKRQLAALVPDVVPIAMRVPPKIKKRTKFVQTKGETSESVETESKTSIEDVLIAAEERLRDVQLMYDDVVSRYDNVLIRLDSITAEYDSLRNRKEKLTEQVEVQLKESAIKEKTGIVLMHGEESVDKLQAAIAKRERQIANIELQWRSHKEELVEQLETVQRSRMDKNSQTRDLEVHLQLVRDDMEHCRKDYQDKDVQISGMDERVKQLLKNSPSQSKQSRNEFTKRILELTENRKKQNSEIAKILTDIFTLQKEINSLRGKLERSFVETNECIFANARRDEVSKKMYKVVVNIHDNCENLVGVIEEKGKLLREIRDLDMSIASENREVLEKNLAKITVDYEDARDSCDSLRRLTLQHTQSVPQ